jgi:hypothetical protein
MRRKSPSMTRPNSKHLLTLEQGRKSRQGITGNVGADEKTRAEMVKVSQYIERLEEMGVCQ